MAVVSGISISSMSRLSLLTKCLSTVGFGRNSSFLFCHPLSLRKPLTSSALQNDLTTAVEEVSENKLIKELAGLLDIRVGLVVRAWKHPEADSLYVEQVDIGEKQLLTLENQLDNNNNNVDDDVENTSASLRLICSGLVNYMPLHLLQDRKVVVLANLKPRNMRGVKSFGMLMAASDSSHENVELLEPPESSLPGDRIWFGDVDQKDNLPDAASPNQIQKKKIWELVQPHLKTNSSCVAVLGEDVMRTSAGVVRCRSLKDANVS